MLCRAWASAAMLLLCSAGSAFGGFVTVTGHGVLVSPPASVDPGVNPVNEYVVFQERTGVLTSSLTLDESGADKGGHDGTSTLVPITLPKGTQFATTFVNLDPDAENASSGSAVLHFSTPILGIDLRSASLSATDSSFGHPGTTYPTGNSARGVPLSKDDKFTIAGNGKNLELNFTADDFSFVQIRIFTAAPVPEPSTLMVWLTTGGLVGIVVLRRIKRPIAA